MTRNIKEFVNHGAASVEHPVSGSADQVCVLLAHYNGAGLLGQQLESIAHQTHRNWTLIISDDGSDDDWLDVATEFAARAVPGRTWLVSGPGKGFAQNFLSLVQLAGPIVAYAAFCDQDDVWIDEKLERAIARLKKTPDGQPAIYCSRTMVCDSNLTPVGPSPLFERAPTFRNALVQNIGGGNTMVMNRAALDLVQDTLQHAKGVVSHDWWVYQLVTGAGGHVIYDHTPSLLYRQHGDNAVGANNTWSASLSRLIGVLRGRFRDWNSANVAALLKVQHWLTPEARVTLACFVAARNGSFPNRIRAFRRSGIYRQTRRGNLALWFAALTHRL